MGKRKDLRTAEKENIKLLSEGMFHLETSKELWSDQMIKKNYWKYNLVENLKQRKTLKTFFLLLNVN